MFLSKKTPDKPKPQNCPFLPGVWPCLSESLWADSAWEDVTWHQGRSNPHNLRKGSCVKPECAGQEEATLSQSNQAKNELKS